MKKTIALLLLASTVGAAPCTTLSTVGFNQDQINLVQGLAYSIGYGIDNQTQPPTVTQGQGTVTVCFQNPSFDAVTSITIASLTAQYNLDTAARAAAKAQYDAWSVELSTTITAVTNGYANFGSLTQAQINQGTKGVVRILMLRELLGLK